MLTLELSFPHRKGPIIRHFKSRVQAGTYLSEFMDLEAYTFPDPYTANHIRSEVKLHTDFPIKDVLKEAVVVNLPDLEREEPQHEQSIGPRKTLAELAHELKVEPRVARQKLRKAARHRDKWPELARDASKGARWEWDTASPVFKEVVGVLSQ